MKQSRYPQKQIKQQNRFLLKMKKINMRKILIRSTLFFVTIMLLIMCTIFLLQYMEKKKMQKQGNELIIKIEEYRLQNKKLPENVSELGIDECEGFRTFL